MASIKKKSGGGGGGANWMDTYGDMVTLLLCFFVLLYSISTIDQQKWMWVVQSFNKDAIVSVTEDPTGPDGDNADDGGAALPITDEVDHAMEALYEFLAQYAQNNQDASISVSRGDGYVFISFDDAVFFDGDSYILRREGQEILDYIVDGLNTAGPYIDELRVLGHTAQRVADAPNPVPGDRYLASNRATAVTIYLQERIDSNQLDPGRLVSVGYGQWRPISSNETGETRAKNRRVELVVTGQDLAEKMGNEYNQYFAMYQEANGQQATGEPTT